MRRKHTVRPPGGDGASNIAAPSAEELSTTVRTLLAEAQALSARLAALNEVAVAMQRSTDTGTMLQVMASQARWVIDFQLCALVERHGADYRYHVLRSSRPLEEPARMFHRRAIDQVLSEGHVLMAADLTPEDDAPPGMCAAMLLPLYDRDQVIGTLNFYTGTSQSYSPDDLRVATALSMQVAVILRNARLFATVTHTRDELHTVLESISDGVLVIDRRGRIVLINRAMRALINQPAAEVDGRRLLWLLRMPGIDRARLLSRATLHQALSRFRQHIESSAELTVAPQPLNGTLVLSDGRHLAWVCAPLLALGPSEGYVITVRDVSAQVALEQLREDMTQMLVHDLRTPLATIIMGLDLLPLDQQFGDPRAQAKTFERTQRAARSLLSQVNLLLEVNKLESGHIELKRKVCVLPALIQAAIGTLEPIADSKNQRLLLVLADDLPEIFADGDLLRRVLENLLSNACKFAPQNSDIALGARYERQPQQIEIWVQDAGPGVPPNMREHVFEKYGQVHATAREGTGIGLTFCRLVVEAHGGYIGVRDAPGGGSMFWFRLPLRPT
jgi:two-component system, NtrC family, sensor histidine kinase KinB